MTLTLSRRLASASASIVAFMASMVVVSTADRPSTSAPLSLTVPITTLPADASTSGTNISPLLKRAPTTLMPPVSPCVMVSTGSAPASIAFCVSLAARSSSPSITRSENAS